MKDLRQFIGECEKRLPREFVRISKEVDPKFEITAIRTVWPHGQYRTRRCLRH